MNNLTSPPPQNDPNPTLTHNLDTNINHHHRLTAGAMGTAIDASSTQAARPPTCPRRRSDKRPPREFADGVWESGGVA
ncbi:hypothetical protein DFJ58DRAFT_723289 [Suillus subalutaceus]|uniref:uncharacterized protein n=1 Tax=Suillus subalutaceus TaxID=48586 RepID=UPI001B86F7F0|nr:uncharacterized protein DFJ58DRAFT_723289 [Suillus subalutaceus]KAG1869434.1 hypothetical protein DFJ58DRAFT_723289 [Suillus subalutaceus]